MPSHTLCALTRLSPCIARFRFWAQTPRRLHSIGRRQHTTLEHTFRARQLDACAEDVMPPGTQDLLATLTTPYKSTPVGFEPTRGGPIGLAGWRLSRSAKVFSANLLQVSCIPVQAVMRLSVSASCAPLTSPSHPLSPTSWEQCASAGSRTRVRWQRCILPLDHWCLWKIFGLDSYRLQIPCTPFSSSLHDTTFSRQSTPHFVALFQPPVRNPQETLGNPWKPSQLQRKPGGNPL